MSGNLSVAVFRRGWVTFGEYLTGKGASPINECWCQKTRVIAVSCGIKISAVHHLVLSQYKRLIDRDRQTDGRTNRQNCEYRKLHYMQSHGKNGVLLLQSTVLSTDTFFMILTVVGSLASLINTKKYHYNFEVA